jgi:hypothetical protein
MGIALSVLTKNQWKQVLDSKGVISTQKLAQVLAKKHMGQIDYLPNLDDPDEIHFYEDWDLPLPFDCDLDEMESRPSGPTKPKKSGNPERPDGPCPGST